MAAARLLLACCASAAAMSLQHSSASQLLHQEEFPITAEDSRASTLNCPMMRKYHLV